MPASTPKLALPYPLPTDQVSEGAADIQALAARLEAVLTNTWRNVAIATRAGNLNVDAPTKILDAGAAVYAGVKTRLAFSVRGSEGADYLLDFRLYDAGVLVVPLMMATAQPYGEGAACVYAFTPAPGAHTFQIYANTSNATSRQLFGPMSLVVDELLAGVVGAPAELEA